MPSPGAPSGARCSFRHQSQHSDIPVAVVIIPLPLVKSCVSTTIIWASSCRAGPAHRHLSSWPVNDQQPQRTEDAARIDGSNDTNYRRINLPASPSALAGFSIITFITSGYPCSASYSHQLEDMRTLTDGFRTQGAVGEYLGVIMAASFGSFSR